MNEVILYNFGLVQPFKGGDHPKYNCGLNFISLALREIGIDTILLSSKQTTAFDRPLAIGFSTWTLRFEEMGDFSRNIKDLNPDVPLIAGGPHFGKRLDQVSQERLLKTKIDAYSTGSGHGFIEFIKSLKEGFVSYNESRFTGEIPDGIFIRDRDSFVGKDGRRLLKVKRFPQSFLQFIPAGINLNSDSYLLYVFTPPCQSRCDYCNFCNTVKFGSSPEVLYSNLLDRNHHKIDTVLITALGGNDSHTSSLNIIETVGNVLERKGYSSLYALYGDPSDLLSKHYLDANIKFYASNRVALSYWGRETVDAQIALNLGRRYRRMHRHQDRLDSEKQALKKFLLRVNKDLRMKSAFTISYMFTPWETRKSIDSMRQEIEEFNHLRPILENIELRIALFNLIPITGSTLRQRYYNDIDHSVPFTRYDGIHSIWKKGPSRIFEQEIIDYAHKYPGNERYQFVNELLEKLHRRIKN